MTDLQLGLLVVGAAAVVAVVLYNRVQERKAGRDAQRAFGSGHADALLGEPRKEPALEAGRLHPRKAEMQAADMPDARIDYVIDLEIGRGTLSATVLEHWKPVEQRFAHRVLLAGSDGDGWRRVVAGDARSLTALRAALQMASRAGAASEPELVEFRSGVETAAAALGARVAAAPELRAALEAARELDRFCADADIQVALHVSGGVPQALEPTSGEFRIERRDDGLSLVLDVPRTAAPSQAFGAMARAGQALAAAAGGRLVDDNGGPIDERSLAAIGAELQAIESRLAQAGIEPGSALALRLFS